MKKTNLDFLTIGHVCHDWSDNGNILGGTASYASLFAEKMGMKTGVLTSFGRDFEFQDLFQNISLQNIPSTFTTYFKNEYNGLARQQYLLKKANNIFTKDIPSEWKDAKMVLLGPIANEIDFSILDKFPDALVAVCPQGWMRRWNDDGKVFQKMLEDWTVFRKVDIVILSEEDLNYQLDLIPKLAALFKILVVTKSEEGADVFFNNNKHTFHAFDSNVVDPTGAGDIFATAFLIRYFETKNINTAAIFANSAASLCIEKKGIKGIPNKKEIINRIEN